MELHPGRFGARRLLRDLTFQSTMSKAMRLLCATLMLIAPLPLRAQNTPLDEAAQLIQAGRFADAKALVLPIAAREPDNARVAFLAGRALIELDDADAAAKHFERAVQKQPNNSEY
jgi:predicted Zn-dependent protease